MFPSGQKKRIQWGKTEILGIGTLSGSPSIALRASGYSGSPVCLGERGEDRVRELDQGYSNHHCLPLFWASTLKCPYSLPANLGQERELGRSGKQGVGGDWHQLPLSPQPDLNLGIVQTSECQSCHHRVLNADIAPEQVTEPEADIIQKL